MVLKSELLFLLLINLLLHFFLKSVLPRLTVVVDAAAAAVSGVGCVLARGGKGESFLDQSLAYCSAL